MFFLTQLNVGQLQFDSGRMIPASKYGQQEEELQLELSDEEKQIETKLKVRIGNDHLKTGVREWQLSILQILTIYYFCLYSQFVAP